MPLATARHRLRFAVCVLALLSLSAPATAETPVLPNETARVDTLPEVSPHWFLVNDFNGPGTMDSKVYLFDGDSGRMLGMLSTGVWRNVVEPSPDFSTVYSPETYYARGTRGERTDTVTFYDTRTLSVRGEAVIPSRRASGMPHRAYSGLSDDGRFVYVSNMTPANSVSIVDTTEMAFASEIDTAGCAMIYPTGSRSFAALCSDGTLQNILIDDAGALAERSRSARFFDPEVDPVTEKAVRLDTLWYFISFAGQVHPVDVSELTPKPRQHWPLLSPEELAAGFRVGGIGFAAVHAATRELYVIINQDGPDAHKNPGKVVRVYDIDSARQVRSIELAAAAGAIAVSQDPEPLMYATNMGIPAIFVYDARTGAHLRTIEGPPSTPTFVQVPEWVNNLAP
ncbi:MAG: amine dehydrogenase large subunit [Pseudomonadales bacterium]